MARTIVYQSYRTHDVPGWISRCLNSVESWANAQGYDYEFVDDRMFDYVPKWFRDKVGGYVLPISDLARLELAQEYLGKGWDRTIWVDADVLVFCPDKLTIDVTEGFAFCPEVWMEPHRFGRFTAESKIANFAAVFVKGNTFLDFYIDSCKHIVQNAPNKAFKLEIGPTFLTHIYAMLHFQLLDCISILGPPVLHAVAENAARTVKEFCKFHNKPIYAANLCGNYRNTSHYGPVMTDDVFDKAIDKLLDSHGEAINFYI